MARINSLILITFIYSICASCTWAQKEIRVSEKTELVRSDQGTPTEFFSFTELVFGKVTHPEIEWREDEKEFCIYGVNQQKALELTIPSVSVTKLVKLENGASPWQVYSGTITSCVLSMVISGRTCSTDGTPQNAYYDYDALKMETNLENVVWENLEGLSGEKKDFTKQFIQKELERMLNAKVQDSCLENTIGLMKMSEKMATQVYSIGLAAVKKQAKRERSLDRASEL